MFLWVAPFLHRPPQMLFFFINKIIYCTVWILCISTLHSINGILYITVCREKYIMKNIGGIVVNASNKKWWCLIFTGGDSCLILLKPWKICSILLFSLYSAENGLWVSPYSKFRKQLFIQLHTVYHCAEAFWLFCCRSASIQLCTR